MKDKVFITGITGFIGSELAFKLLKKGYKVEGLTRQSIKENNALLRLNKKGVKLHVGNLRDYFSIENILQESKPDFIIHLGAITPVSYSPFHPQEVTEVNYIGTINLVEAARKHLPKLKLMTMASSMEVYGYQSDTSKPFTENMIPHPRCPYAIAKLACEKYLEYCARIWKFPCTILRQTNCFGRKENDYFVVEAIINQMIKSNKIKLGRKEPTRNFIHVDDLTDLHLALLKDYNNIKLYGNVFNTGPDNGLTIGELADKIKKMLNWKGKIQWNTREVRAFEVYCLNSSNNSLINTINWKPKISLDDGLKETINYWKMKNEK